MSWARVFQWISAVRALGAAPLDDGTAYPQPLSSPTDPVGDESGPWRVKWRGGRTYELINDATEPLFHIELYGSRIVRPVEAFRIDGGGSLLFEAVATGGERLEIMILWEWSEDPTT